MPDMEICSECHRPIEDQYVLRVGDSSLHQDCLKCAACRAPLTDSCFSKFGQFYCKQDFYRMFGPRCSICQQGFTETEKVRKIGESQFHTQCFTCHDCSANLTEGDKVGCDHKGNIFCEIDYIKHSNGHHGNGSTNGSELSDESNNYYDLDTSNSTIVTDTNDEMMVKRETKSPDSKDNQEDDEDEDDRKETDYDGEMTKDGKRRGPRTTIKAKQLEILKQCFDQNPKPTRQVREQLAKDTGLPMRVIQVWFQNKRSKQKRINQMQYITGRGFHPHMGMPFPPHPYGPPGPFFGPPPNGMPGDFPPPPPHHMFHPGTFGPDCGPPGPPDFNGPPYIPHHSPYPRGPDNFGPHDQSGRMSESPNHCYPSPPTHPSDYHGPLPGDYSPGPGAMPPSSSAEPCFPSPPLDYSCPDTGYPSHNNHLDVNVKQELPTH